MAEKAKCFFATLFNYTIANAGRHSSQPGLPKGSWQLIGLFTNIIIYAKKTTGIYLSDVREIFVSFAVKIKPA